MFPAPLSEDFGVFIAQEYNTGFPANAFVAYQGYLHLLPRIITWIAMKFDLSSVMTIMNWTVLFIKALIFYLIYKSKEINDCLIRVSLLVYLVLLPFPDEIYNNVTNLQWWFIPFMAMLIAQRERSIFSLTITVCSLVLLGLTGVNSVIFAIPSVYLLAKFRNRNYLIKCLTIIICACVQFYFLYTSGRSGNGIIAYNGSIAEIVHLFVNRIIYHTLFNINYKGFMNFVVLLIYIAVLILNFYIYRKNVFVRFVCLFSVIYTVIIFYNLLKSSSIHNDVLGYSDERYFVFLRICSFILLISSLNMLFKFLLSHQNYKRILAHSCFILCLVLLKNYHASLLFYNHDPKLVPIVASEYYDDIRIFKAAKSGDVVKFDYYYSSNVCGHPETTPWACVLIKK